jgi:fluoride ion exporter CrcB/FEX
MSVIAIVPTPALAPALSTRTQAGLAALGGTSGCRVRSRAGVRLSALPGPITAGALAFNVVGGLCTVLSRVAFAKARSDFRRLLLVTGVPGGMTTPGWQVGRRVMA